MIFGLPFHRGVIPLVKVRDDEVEQHNVLEHCFPSGPVSDRTSLGDSMWARGTLSACMYKLWLQYRTIPKLQMYVQSQARCLNMSFSWVGWWRWGLYVHHHLS